MVQLCRPPSELFGGEWEQISNKFVFAAGEGYTVGSEAVATQIANAIAAEDLDKYALANDLSELADRVKVLEDAGYATEEAVAQVLTEAKAYADNLANNYDTKGSAAQALTDAKAYADSLADDYDVAGAADQALTDAKAYSDNNLSVAKAYSDANLASAKTYSDNNLVTGKTYTDEQIATIMALSTDEIDAAIAAA